MSRIHHDYVPGAIVFITQVVHWRAPVFGQMHFVDLLHQNLYETKRHHPFAMIGYCFLPEHFHLMIRPSSENFQRHHAFVQVRLHQRAQNLSWHLGKNEILGRKALGIM